MKCRYYVNLALLRVDKEFIRFKDIKEHDYLELFIEYYSSIYCDNPFEAMSLSKKEEELASLIKEKGIDNAYQNLEIIGKKIGELEDEYTFIDRRTNNIVFIYARTTRQTIIQQKIDNLLFNELEKEEFVDELESFIDFLSNKELIEFVESNYIEELKLRDFILSTAPPFSDRVNSLHRHIIERYNSSYDNDYQELNEVPFIVKSRSMKVIEALEQIENTHKEEVRNSHVNYKEVLSQEELEQELDSSSDTLLDEQLNENSVNRRGTALERFNKRINVDNLESVLDNIKHSEVQQEIVESNNEATEETSDIDESDVIDIPKTDKEEIKLLNYTFIEDPSQ